MRAISLSLFRLLLGPLTLVLLVACASDESSPKKSDELDTQHLYINDSKIYSFEPNEGNSKTGKSFKHAVFNPGTIPLRLNTNEDKQGFEFIVFIDDNEVRILDYIEMRNFSLSTFSGQACNLYPRIVASDKAFVTGSKFVHHDSSVIVGLISSSENCEDIEKGSTHERLILLDFKIKDNRVKFEIDQVSESEIATITKTELMPSSVATKNKLFNGDLLIQYGDVDSKSFGFLGTSTPSNDIVFYNEDYEVEWSYDPGPNIDVIKVKQFSRTEALVSIDTEMYRLSINDIFTATQLSEDPLTSSLSKINTLFDQPTYDLPVFETEPAIYEIIENSLSFAVQIGNSVFSDTDNDLTHVNNPSDEASIVRVTPYLMSNSAIIIHTKQQNTDQVSIVEKDSDSEITLDTGNKKITMVRVAGNKVYVNLFDPDYPSDLSKAEARLYDAETNIDRLDPTIYKHSQFVSLPDARRTTPNIMLLSADISTSDSGVQSTSNPSLYAFDSNEINGRKQARSTEKGNKVLIDFSYGNFPHAIYLDSINESDPEKIDENVFGGSIIDDIHGDLLIESSINNERVAEKYFFNPGQEDPDANKFTLRRMSEIQ